MTPYLYDGPVYDLDLNPDHYVKNSIRRFADIDQLSVVGWICIKFSLGQRGTTDFRIWQVGS